MAKLVKIGEYWVNPDNVAFVSETAPGENRTQIVFNAYAAAATVTDFGYEALVLYIDIPLDQVAKILNGEG